MSRIAIFIDGAYLSSILKNEFNSAQVAYEKLSSELSNGIEVLRTYYYNCLPYQSASPTVKERERFSKAQSFIYALSSLPRYQVRLGKLAFRGIDQEGKPIFQQKQVDILLGVDLVLLSATRQISNAALLMGDSDFFPAVKVAKEQGILTTLWHSTKYPPHIELWQECDERKVIDKSLIDRILR